MPRNLRSSIFSIILLCLLGAEKTFAWSGSSNVTCHPSYSWASNSKGQNPCVVAASLQSVCNDGVFTVNSLPEGYHYIGPRQDDPSTQNVCICSTPVYELMSACADCQNRTYISWSAWSLYCTNFPSVQEGIYNASIPRETAIPQWAFEKPSQNDDM
ncbi:uncharacterized protein EI90DRAFT_3037040 [Cantharellus anzutake]|uniref:uncharacterized protein n=1 Tax=Cantharellus anzutake TaxID=1750568 RepID=UPI0019046A54|nr:uncharacterized protein EI90DRAFT_3037040 [Cantharellus anzutake]KAF8339551.1 hypothetical protein EI90DRAFT_3037040 [Cantharellus anzutake]